MDNLGVSSSKDNRVDSNISNDYDFIGSFYTPFDEAITQLRKRCIDQQLRAKVESFRRYCPPDFIPSEPFAALSRFVITPNREYELFTTRAFAAGLRPLCLDHEKDFYTPINPEKYRLCRPVFEMAPNHNRVLRLPIKDFSTIHAGRRRLNELQLRNGMRLCDFHRELRKCSPISRDCIYHDFSDWFSSAKLDNYFYLHYLSLFICDGILFDNFLSADAEEWRFAYRRVLPAINKAVELFGVKPLIVQLFPRESETKEILGRMLCIDGSYYTKATSFIT